MIGAAAALGDHLLGRDLRAEEGALQVDRHHLLVLRLGGVEDRRAGLDAGVVDHHVEPAERLDRLVDEPLQVLDLADVGLHADGLVAELRDLAFEVLGRLLVGDVVDDDVGALAGEGEGDGLADAAVAAGDDGDLALQCHVVPPAGSRRERAPRTTRRPYGARRPRGIMPMA